MKLLSTLLAILVLQTGCTTAKLLTTDEMREAIIANDSRAVRRSLKAGYDLNTEVAYCFPALPFAAAMKRDAVVNEMLSPIPTNTSIDIPTCMGHTALHFAVINGDAELESLLKRRGANPAAQDKLGRTPEEFRSVADPIH